MKIANADNGFNRSDGIVVNLANYWWTSREEKSLGVQEVSGCFRKGTPNILCGASGSGKTTLAMLLAGLISPDSGNILFEQRPIEEARERIAFLFQFPENIFFCDTIIEEFKDIRPDILEVEVDEILANLRLDGSIKQKHPFHLSHGVGRLAAFAVQMARRPEILILDEPTIGLDDEHYSTMLSHLKNWMTTERILIVVTHDLDFMKALGGKAHLMQKGRLKWSGDTEALLKDESLLHDAGLSG